MSTYWTDFARLLIPGLILMLPSVIPTLIGTSLAAYSLLRKATGAYIRHIWAGTAAGIVALGLLFSSLFGSGLRGSSTAGLIFLFVPIYSAVALGLGYGFGAVALRKLNRNASVAGAPQISRGYRRFVWVPVAIVALLLFGMFRYSIQHNDLTVAERASNPETLHYVYGKSLRGDADSFGIPLFLGQNPNTPADILADIAKHRHSSVRIFVARHPNTPVEALARLTDDCDPSIRKTASERLKDSSRAESPLATTSECR